MLSIVGLLVLAQTENANQQSHFVFSFLKSNIYSDIIQNTVTACTIAANITI